MTKKLFESKINYFHYICITIDNPGIDISEVMNYICDENEDRMDEMAKYLRTRYDKKSV